MGELASGAGPKENAQIERLAGYNKDHEESHLAIAKAAIAAGMWQEAREHLLATEQTHPACHATWLNLKKPNIRRGRVGNG